MITNNTIDEVGVESIKNLTIKLICQRVRVNFRITIKHSSMAVILHRLNLSCTKPTYVLKSLIKRNKKFSRRILNI
ncbi:winged helix-turn-helix domain-containing protein [Clostridium beijerinckii]|uniref:winged helix-turn-helix domain-containing protein n=1 Tax=Clostridium beijerinckii TaxID=1520 RepID=UPI001361B165|nr:winged helix-turn-helix domain-containing protein [Clostridium beijerinckii]MBN7581524.1 winged helix-turn-helix domain-containing protein [Clostridium beijerinckii]MBO0522421.1 winged helix-turn-helix domain-containing protein [Clostridium beijerinckii]MZK52968.1 hypothetical protein [Clostridium beijerinckii]MZK61069.1 hypothetical protein [Clostridium beijerinckii]